MLVHPDGTREPLAIGVPGDRDVDEKRLGAQVEPAEVEAFTEADFAANPALVKGYIGPGALGLERHSGIRYLLDPRVSDGTRWVTGADTAGRHVIDLVAGRDFTADGTIEAAEVRFGDPCPECDHTLSGARGIEMGHVFQLGTKYAEALDLKVLDQNGKLVTVVMGSYGVGVSRAVACVVEGNHDEAGIIWPRELAPADVHVVVAGKDESLFVKAEEITRELEVQGLHVLVDDRRGVSPGVKFKDSELVGVPTILVVGRGLANGTVEIKDRRSGAAPRGRRRRRRRCAHRRGHRGGRALVTPRRRRPVEAVVFDWGGTLTPWHEIDLPHQWRRLRAHGAGPAVVDPACRRGPREADSLAMRLPRGRSARGPAVARRHEGSARLHEIVESAGAAVGRRARPHRRRGGIPGLLGAAHAHGRVGQATLGSPCTKGVRVGVLSNTIWDARLPPRGIFERDGVLDLLDVDIYSSETPS